MQIDLSHRVTEECAGSTEEERCLTSAVPHLALGGYSVGEWLVRGRRLSRALGSNARTRGTLMPDQPSPDIELLRAAYAAFNARDIDAALATMTPDVAWPKAFKGGFARGHQAVRAYWTEQWSEIDPHVEPASFRPDGAGCILVDVHQVVRDMAGAVVA